MPEIQLSRKRHIIQVGIQVLTKGEEEVRLFCFRGKEEEMVLAKLLQKKIWLFSH